MIRMISHHDFLMKHLADPKEAAAYLNSVAEDRDIKALLKALRNVVEAQGGVGHLAKKTKLSRTTLYKTLSETGNPEVATLNAILNVYNIRMGFFPAAISPRKVDTYPFLGLIGLGGSRLTNVSEHVDEYLSGDEKTIRKLQKEGKVRNKSRKSKTK